MVGKKYKSVPKSWKRVMTQEDISRAISRMAYEISEQKHNLDRLAIVGIRTGGEFIARRILDKLKKIESREDINFGIIDITLYRDDLSHANEQPELRGTDLNFAISRSKIVLVDDVLYSGRTARAALDAITDFGRPHKVELAVLVDRGHRELPIRADYVGKNIPTSKDDFIRVRLEEMGYKPEGVYLISSKG